MSELGSGSGSSYPSALDTNAVLEVNSPSGSKTKARAEVPNDHGAAIVAVQTELGTDPAGSLADVKTYLQTEHAADGTHTIDVIAEKTATSGVTVDGCLIKDSGVTAIIDQGGGSVLKVKVIEIGDWNMDATGQVQIPHSLSIGDIRSISAVIRRDDDSVYYQLTPSISTVNLDGYISSWDATNITLARFTGGQYDGINYDSTSYNRGWVTIWYV